MYTIVGLGNPGEEYEKTRHNTGRLVLEAFLKMHDIALEPSKKYKGLYGAGTVKKAKARVLFPETYMNKSGGSVATIITSKKKAESLIVIYDDLDLALGTVKISFDRGSGGHKGIESIVRALKTRAFIRIRIGVSTTTPGGKLKKPKGEKDVERFILGEFSSKEKEKIAKMSKVVAEILETILLEGREIATSRAHTS